MRVHSSVVAAVVIISLAAFAGPTEAAQRQRSPGGAARGGGGNGGNGNGNGGGGQRQAGERRAEPRNGGGRRDSGGEPASRPSSTRQTSRARQQPEPRQQPESRGAIQRQPAPGVEADLRRGTGEPWINGPAGLQPRVAVPRPGSSYGSGYSNRSGYRVYSPAYGQPYKYYNHSPYKYKGYAYVQPYYYYPYAYGYGPYGRGSFYFDAYYNSNVFYPPAVVRYDNNGTYGYPTGELRLQVRPREAQVFIDGAYAGTVDEFDGTFQSLRLEEGDYKVELVLPGYAPLDFDLHITPGEKVTYRADLVPEQP